MTRKIADLKWNKRKVKEMGLAKFQAVCVDYGKDNDFRKALVKPPTEAEMKALFERLMRELEEEIKAAKKAEV